MRVVFSELSDLVQELKDRLIHEVRIEPLYDRRYDKNGIGHLMLYVSVEAVIDDKMPLVGVYERGTYIGFAVFANSKEAEEFHERNREKAKEIYKTMTDSGFTVRRGHYVEEVK
jgi:hypothetical protein